MTPLLPAPENGGPRNESHGGESSSHRDGPRIPTIDEILQQLLALNGLVTLGIMSTAKASIIHRTLRTILETHLKKQAPTEQGLPTEVLAELCRREPALLNLVAPLLRDDQVDWIRKHGLGDHGNA